MNRSLAKIGFVDRKKSIAKKTPFNWDTIVRESAHDIRDAFKEAGVEVVCSMDEFFNHFHCGGNSVLVPKGTKRVGSATKLGNEKEGCTVVVTMTLEASVVLKPTIVFAGMIDIHSYILH